MWLQAERHGFREHTLGIVLQDLQIHVCVCNDNVELFVEGKKFRCNTLKLVLAAPKEHHFVWFFLFDPSALLLTTPFVIRLTVYPVNHTPLKASPIKSMPVLDKFLSVVT